MLDTVETVRVDAYGTERVELHTDASLADVVREILDTDPGSLLSARYVVR